ncbi:hypothetical protein GUJ93_ZPchr0011g27887 [Zizania palustris]|uniref:Uncharacterized protein n=1 Tax=Zizania palustris TaxID=103762 RepID=A0A8J6BSX4_ZIZPA|nr:hypothetical protein GUJ93_ZPchr0011g27887 [Zizania palustris]
MRRMGLGGGHGGRGEGDAARLPERPGEEDCVYYLRTDACGFSNKQEVVLSNDSSSSSAMDDSSLCSLPSGNDDSGYSLCSQVDDSFDGNHDEVVVSHHDDVLLSSVINCNQDSNQDINHDEVVVSHDMLLYGTHDDGSLDVLLLGAHDVIYDNLHYNQDVSHDWLNELDEEDFNELLSG